MVAERGNWNRLPDELSERILALLPAPSVVTARCVCRRWRSLVSTPSFAALWSASAPRVLWFLAHRDCRSIAACDPRSARWYRLPVFHLCSLDPAACLPLASAGGLICFRDRDADSPLLAVCNPLSAARRVLPTLPHIQYIDIVGMAADRATDSYTILLTGTCTSISSESITQIYDSRTRRWVYHNRSEQEFLQSFFEVHAVWHEGAFYCLATLDYRLIRYDLDKREWMDLNIGLPAPALRKPSLLVSAGKLLLAGKLMEGFFSRSICIWELEVRRDCSQWVMVDVMPNELFKAMHHPYSTIIRCQGHGDLICFITNQGSKSVVYDMMEREWWLLPENQMCIQNRRPWAARPPWAARNNVVGLSYELSLSAAV